MLAFRVFVFCLLGALVVFPQGIVTTVVGNDWIFSANGVRALEAPLSPIIHVTVNREGRPVFADPGNASVVRLNGDGTLTTLAGNGIATFSGDGGPAVNAALNTPQAVAYDSKGNLYISDVANNRIRVVGADGSIRTLIGSLATGFEGDNGPVSRAKIDTPGALAVDSADNLYFVDRGNGRIRRVSPQGVVTTVAGNGLFGFAGENAPATQASIGLPEAIAVDRTGNLYIADTENHRLRRVSPQGVITTLAGTGRAAFTGDNGPALQASLNRPSGIAIDQAGVIYFSDTNNGLIRRISATGTISTFGGNGRLGFAGDNAPAIGATLNANSGLALDLLGNLLIADRDNFRVRSINTAGIITTLAGNGRFRVTPANTSARNAFLFRPNGIATDSRGSLYIADTGNNYLHSSSSSNSFLTLAGTGVRQDSTGNRPPLSTPLANPIGVTTDFAGNIYVSDTDNNRVRRLSPAGVFSIVAGNGNGSFSGDDGPAAAAGLDRPTYLVFDTANNLYVADTANHRIRRISPAGTISTFAGNGNPRFAGDNGSATAASLNAPYGLLIDRAGNLLIADTRNSRIRRVTPDGRITTFAGGGTRVDLAADGFPATEASLVGPVGLTADALGNILFSDSDANRVRRISTQGVLSTVAGNGQPGYSGDGDFSTRASFSSPQGLAFNLAGDLLIADAFNNRIRSVLARTVTLQASPSALSFRATSGGPGTEPKLVTLGSTLSGLAFAASSPAPWLRFSPSIGASPIAVSVSADPANLAPGTYTTILILAAPTAGATTPVNVSFVVAAPDPARLSIDRTNINFSFLANAEPLAEAVLVKNLGGGTVPYTATVRTFAGGNWLAVSPGSGRVSAAQPQSLSLTANPKGLAPGTYTANLTVTGPPSAPVVTPIVMTVVAPSPRIRLSQSGLSFTAVAGSASSAPQEILILNSGAGSLNWTATASTLSGGSSWISLDAASGQIPDTPGAFSRLRIAVDGAALRPGDYYARVDIRSPGIPNSPQTITAVLSVLAAGTTPGPQIHPSSLIFSSPAGESPGSQTITVSNLTGTPFAYAITSSYAEAPSNWLQFAPANAVVLAGRPAQIVVQPDFRSLKPGVSEATLHLAFDDGKVGSVAITAIASDPADAVKDRALTACTPTKLTTTVISPQPSFNATVGQSVPFEVQLTDSCGVAVTAADFYATISNRDPDLKFNHTTQGRWTSAWVPQIRVGEARVKISMTALYARSTGATVVGGADVSASLAPANSTLPIVPPGSVRNGASFEPFQVVAPGSFISIFGVRLADGASEGQAPFPTSLAGTEVSLGDSKLPLSFTRGDQINAIVPFGLPLNSQLQLLVKRGDALSFGESLSIASVQPAIFTQQQTGVGQGAIVNGVSNVLADAANPVRAGDVISIYCTGLGDVSPAVSAGQPASLTVLSRTAQPVIVTIGGQNAAVTFSGLAPGYAGLYQVNAVIPVGLPANNATPITMTIGGQGSPAEVTLAVR